MKLRILDLFSGAGGCSVGYYRGFTSAGFDVDIVGVDHRPQPNYPYRFVQADAMTFPLDGFDLIHASPPCQAHTAMSNRWRGHGGVTDSHDTLIAATRRRLEDSGAVWVIENVPGARAHLRDALTLTGAMFGLGVHRPRLFECSVFVLTSPPAPPPQDAVGVYGRRHDGRLLWRRADGTEQRAAASLAEAHEAMGIDWMRWDELKEAIPPAYTRFLAEQIAPMLTREAA